MPQPNYQFAKRQRELEKKRKNAEKAARKAANANGGDERPPETGTDEPAPPAPPEQAS